MILLSWVRIRINQILKIRIRIDRMPDITDKNTNQVLNYVFDFSDGTYPNKRRPKIEKVFSLRDCFDGLFKKFWSKLIGCVLRTAGSSIITIIVL